MNHAINERFLDAMHAFDHRTTTVITLLLGLFLLLTPFAIQRLARQWKINEIQRAELQLRFRSWLVLVPAIIVPILLGPGWTIVAIGLLSMLCYREYARATGLFREKVISAFVVLGILLLTFASLDNWYRMFVAISPLTVGAIAMVAILRDQPTGYIQRVALGAFGFLLLGNCLGHLSFLANDRNYRPILLLIFLSVESNDLFAYVTGKTLGKRKLIPNTSPNKTLAGAIGALILTTGCVCLIGRFVFDGTVLSHPIHLVAMGLLTSITGQFGDLMLSSIKRDLGIKDLAATIPGHGGLLDRFDSMIIAAPVLFHYINYFVGIGLGTESQIFTRG